MDRPYRRIGVMSALFGVLAALPSVAQEGAGSPLPLRDVVLFSSGVGYFQRSGEVAGDTSIPLSFRAEQVSDILKSLVVIDPAAGVRPVTYTVQDATSRRLAAVGQGLNGHISLGDLLRKLQGAQIRVEMGGRTVEGRILSVSIKQVPVKDDRVVPVEMLNILTSTGLESLPLDQVTSIRLLDERLDRELRESLELLATGLNDERRTVRIQLAGNQRRQVRAGYLQEMPVWKTTYRLVLDAKEQPFLQGWAIVENTTDEDWNNVRLSLVSGRPISFIQNLYQPLYVPRPVVQPQIVASPLPQTYGETLERVRRVEEQLARIPKITGAVNVGGFGGAPGPAGPPGPAPAAEEAEAARQRRAELSLSAGAVADSAAAQASGAERGDLFEYAISQPVTLPRQQAAMVPIVGERIEGEQVSIYDPNADPRRALRGFRMKNTTGLHLAGGPITVFNDGIYAGDAQITNLQPGEERLLAYAVDLDLVADREPPKFRQDTVSVVAKNGVLHVTRKQQRENTYTFRNKTAEPKTVIVQQNIEPEFKLTAPEKPFERTPDEYRFRVTVPANGTSELKVVTERPISETIALLNTDLNVLISYSQNAQLSPQLRAALKRLVELRGRVVELQTAQRDREEQIKAIDQEQARIRQNMEQLDRNSPLYQQYVRKLTDQEAQIEKLRAEIAQLRQQELQAQKELREYVEGLNVD